MRYVVLKGNMFARPLFDGWAKRLAEAGTFSKSEAENHVAGSKGDGYSTQPLSFYGDFLREERSRIESLINELETNP